MGGSSGKKRGIVCPAKLTEKVTPKYKGRGEKLFNDQRGAIHGTYQRERQRTSTALYTSVFAFVAFSFLQARTRKLESSL